MDYKGRGAKCQSDSAWNWLSGRDRIAKSVEYIKENELIGRIAVNALIACITVLLTLAALEAVVRLGGEIDTDGQFLGYVLEPYAVPVSNKWRENAEAYLKHKDDLRHLYDETLGWTPRPHTVRDWGQWQLTVNSAGLRSRREYSQTPPPDTLRIALFGDSFTAADGVSDDETWGHQLEIKLNQAGIRVEVLNFGVGGYGMGQAFLRWQSQGRHYGPDMVIFGFQSENLNRNVNIFRQLYRSYGIPFSKPRFVLTDQGLELLNVPAIPPEQIIDVFESFGSHPLAVHEYYYQGRNVAGQWWTSSRLAGFLHAALMKQEIQNVHWQENWGADGELGQLGKAIVDAFATDVIKRESDFFVVYLVNRWDLRRHLHHQALIPPYQFMLDHFDETYHYISFEDQLDGSYLDDAYYPDETHYGPELNSIAAQAVADEIQSCIESGACELPRFEDRNVIFTSAS